DADEDDRRLHLGHGGEGAAPFRGPVEFRDDDARDPDRVVERLRLGPGLLPHGRIEHEEAFVCLDRLRDPLDLRDQVRLARVPAVVVLPWPYKPTRRIRCFWSGTSRVAPRILTSSS